MSYILQNSLLKGFSETLLDELMKKAFGNIETILEIMLEE